MLMYCSKPSTASGSVEAGKIQHARYCREAAQTRSICRQRRSSVVKPAVSLSSHRKSWPEKAIGQNGDGIGALDRFAQSKQYWSAQCSEMPPQAARPCTLNRAFLRWCRAYILQGSPRRGGDDRTKRRTLPGEFLPTTRAQ